MPYLLGYPLDDFRNVLEVNLIAPYVLIKNLLPAMAEHGGSIINVTSDAGRVGYPGWGALRHIEVRHRRNVSDVSGGIERVWRARQLRRPRRYEHRNAPRCGTRRRPERVGRPC